LQGEIIMNKKCSLSYFQIRYLIDKLKNEIDESIKLIDESDDNKILEINLNALCTNYRIIKELKKIIED